MRNFNPLFNSLNMVQSTSPFATAGSSFATRATTSGLFPRTGASKITLSGILNGAQKTIGTVNQIVPLYNQIKPMFQNSKILLNVAKGLRNTNVNKSRRYNAPRRNDFHEEPIDVKTEELIKPSFDNKKNEGKSPSKPFFI